MRKAVALALIVLLAIPALARADTCDSYKTPARVLEALNGDDPIAQLTAKTCGLQSDDPAIRGVILRSLVVGLNTMAFDLAPVQADTEGVKMIDRMPQFTLGSISWSKDGRSFEGSGYGGNVGGGKGQLIGETMGIAFHDVLVRPEKPDGQPLGTTCTATLGLPKNGTRLEGSLRCTGLPSRFTISLGL